MTRRTVAARSLLGLGCFLAGAGGVTIYVARMLCDLATAQDRLEEGGYDASGIEVRDA